MDRVLVVSYSRTGNTDRIAEAIAQACGADRDRIVETVDRRGGLGGYLRSAREAWRRKAATLRAPGKDPGAYDLVILGTPVWVGSVCSPMRAYLAAHAAKLGRVAFFCTLGGAGADKTLAEMGRLCGKTPVATLAVTETDLRSGAYRQKLDAFTTSLGRLQSAA